MEKMKTIKIGVHATFAFALLMTTAAGIARAEDLKVSRADAMKAATSKVQPEFPAIAKQLNLEGEVEVEAHVAENGSVESAKPLAGNPVLALAAVKAMKEWKFTPFTDDGKPVKAIVTIAFSFRR